MESYDFSDMHPGQIDLDDPAVDHVFVGLTESQGRDLHEAVLAQWDVLSGVVTERNGTRVYRCRLVADWSTSEVWVWAAHVDHQAVDIIIGRSAD